MTKNKTNTKEKKSSLNVYIINILITLTIFLITLIINDVAPFGNKDLAINDAYYQYKPMLFNFIKSIQEGTLSTYSFTNALGNSFFFNFTYYLSSPLNLFAILFKSANSMFLSVVTIKLLMTTVLTTFYAMKKTNNKVISSIIAISYAFSSWFLAYNQSIMWLDSFMMLPLFQYGLEKLMNENKPYIYILSLAFIMFSNFYMAWMICLYTLAYFIFNTIFTKKELSLKLKSFNTITFSTLITMLIALVYIYITYDSFMNIDLYINSVTSDFTTMPLLNILKSIFTGSTMMNLTHYGKTFPNIALNTIFTISLFYYFINSKIDKKDKLKNLLVFIFIIILLYSKTLNYIMNCFHVPVGYNFRYSFLISFYFIHIFIQNYKNFDNKIYKRVYFINALLLILLIVEFVTKNIELNIFLLNLIPLIIYTLYFIFYKNNKFFKYLFPIIVILEIIVSTIINISPNIERTEKDLIYNKETLNYREENSNDPTKLNFQLYENKNVILYFSSMQYNQVVLDLQTFGCETDNKALISSCPNNQVFKTLLNIKPNNEYHLEKLFAANQKIQNISLNEENYFENQNLLLKTISNSTTDTIIKEELSPIKKQKNKYKITKDGTYYLLLDAKYQVITVGNNAYTYNKELVTNKELNAIEVQNTSYLEFELNKNDTIEITYPKEEDILETLPMYYFDKEEFIKIYNDLKDNQINYTSYKDNSIEGTINVEKDQIIFTSIPYDKNWKVTIDGKEVDKLLILNSLIGIECEPGTHTIKLEYKPKYIVPTIISITTLIGLITFMIINHKKRND